MGCSAGRAQVKALLALAEVECDVRPLCADGCCSHGCAPAPSVPVKPGAVMQVGADVMQFSVLRRASSLLSSYRY